ncbi:hypothetical protein GCM10022284_31940 [Streptomyces hundungensis]
MQLGFAAGPPDPVGVVEGLIAEALGGADVEEGGRQAGQAGGTGGCGIRRHVSSVLGIADLPFQRLRRVNNRPSPTPSHGGSRGAAADAIR